MKKMRQGLLSSLIVLLFLCTVNAFAQLSEYNYAGGFRWNGGQLQYNPDLFYGGTPTSSSVWYNASFNNDGTLSFDFKGESVTISGATSQAVIDAIGSGSSSGGDSSSGWGSSGSGNDIFLAGRKATIKTLYNSNMNARRKYRIIWDMLLAEDARWEDEFGTKTVSIFSTDEKKKQMPKYKEVYRDRKAKYEAPVEIGGWKLRFGLSSSYDEYRYKSLRRLTGEDAYGRMWHTAARVHAVKDRLILSASLGYEEYWGTGLMDRSDYSALSLDFVPQYYLLRQDVELIDLAVFMSLGGEHLWFDDSRLRDDQLDMWHYGGGLGAGRTFRFGDFWLAYLYQCHKNADGDDGVTGDGEQGTHRLGLTYTGLITEQIPVQASIFYNHSSRLPKELDSDDFEGAVRIGWRSESWSLMLGYRQLFDSSDLRNWGIDCKFTYLW